MKRVRIGIGEIGVVTKNGEFERVLNEGVFWIGFNETVIVYDFDEEFKNEVILKQLRLKNKLSEYFDMIEILDTEIVFVFDEGRFSRLLRVGSYAFWKGKHRLTFQRVNMEDLEIDKSVKLGVLRHRDVVGWVRFIEVETFEKGLLFINGKYEKTLDAGTYYYWKTADIIAVKKADLRLQNMEINGQEILTKDKATLRINYNFRYQIVDSYKAIEEVKDFEKQIYSLGQLALREFIGALTLDELLSKKETVNTFVLDSVKADAISMGIEIQTSGIRDVILTGEMKDIMNQVLIAEKRAQANTILRREETASTRSLLNTAKLMEENAMLLKLKEMEYVEKIAERIDNISISGGARVIDEMKQLFGTN